MKFIDNGSGQRGIPELHPAVSFELPFGRVEPKCSEGMHHKEAEVKLTRAFLLQNLQNAENHSPNMEESNRDSAHLQELDSNLDQTERRL